LLSRLTRHFMLMTATPHNGKEENFQLFMALLDGDRFEGRFRDGKKNRTVRFEVKTGKGEASEGTVNRRGATCIVCGTPVPFDNVRAEGKAGRMAKQLMAVVAEGSGGRVYISSSDHQAGVAAEAQPEWSPQANLPHNPRDFKTPNYGMRTFADLFTPRQLVALTTFSDLAGEARKRALADAGSAGFQPAEQPKTAAKMAVPPGWRSRGYLPHFDGGAIPQMITFHLADSLPAEVLARFENELATVPETKANPERRKRIEAYLDSGAGKAWLSRPEVATVVETALLHFDGTRYQLHSWVIMPNHVHALITPVEGHGLAEIVHSWKSYTANTANKLLGLTGPFWQRDYYDRFIRDEKHYLAAVEYIEMNPVKAGLCASLEDWPAGSARFGSPRPGSAGFQPAEDVKSAAKMAALPGADRPLENGGTGAMAYADAVATYLAIAVSRLSDICNALCRWEVSKTQVRNLFGRQAIPMVWDFAEPCIFGSAAGDYGVSLRSMLRVLEATPGGIAGQAKQLDATAATNGVNKLLICTDPPYYDNIGYADLSDFFYVWLRRSLGKVYPNLFSTLLTPKAQELVATPYRFDGSKEKAERFFEEGLGTAFAQIRAAQHPDYPMTVYYAFRQSESESENSEEERNGPSIAVSTGWETMLEGLLKARFGINGTWPMRSELANRPIASGTNALASSIVLVCRPRLADAPLATRREFINALKAELPAALRNLQRGNIAPVDLAQAAIGPGMAVFSRYSKVVEADGSPMSVRMALALINQTLDEVLAEQEGEFDSDTRWAVAWFEQRAFQEGPFGEADVLARAKNTAVNGLVEAGILSGRAGKVRLLNRSELDGDWDPTAAHRLTVWEVTHQLIRALEKDGEAGAGSLLQKVGALGETARDLAYRLYGICERKKWAQQGLAYNSLVIAWPEIVKLARAERPAETQAELQI
jgi:putative DNA methylase